MGGSGKELLRSVWRTHIQEWLRFLEYISYVGVVSLMPKGFDSDLSTYFSSLPFGVLSVHLKVYFLFIL